MLAPPANATLDAKRRYETLRRSENDAWRAIYDAVNDFGALKKLWNERIDELTQERDRLERRLTQTETLLKTAETHRNATARKATRRNSKAARAAHPRLTSREGFMQQLQAELSRVKRTGSAAALALLGIHDLAALAAQQGDGTEAAVLDCYARHILPGFRAYDVITRYDADVFAVLLPDTGQDGAARALEKAQKRATETHVRCHGRCFPLPGFFSALTTFAPGEDPALWLGRAEQALTAARQRDGERMVLA